jgi:hypothetical protein
MEKSYGAPVHDASEDLGHGFLVVSDLFDFQQ